MPVYDRRCDRCERVTLDHLEPIATPDLMCECGGVRRRAFTQRAAAVIGDDIPGGLMVHHGLCNADGTPRRYDSKSEMLREAASRGLQPMVRHTPPDPGSDKAKHTVRWVSAPVISEEDRVQHLRDLYLAEGIDLDHLPARVDASPNLVVEDRLHRIIADAVTQHYGV